MAWPCSSFSGRLLLQLAVFRIQPHPLNRRAVKHAPADPPVRIAPARGEHGLAAAAQYLRVLAAVALSRRHHADAAVAVMLVVAVNEVLHPFLGLLHAFKAIARIQMIPAVLERAEEGFRIRIVIAHPRPAVREGDPAAFKQRQGRRRLHARSVVRVHDKLPGPDAMAVECLSQKLHREAGAVRIEHPGAHHHAAVDVDDDIGVEEPARVKAGPEIRDVPGPDLVGTAGAVGCRPAAAPRLPRGAPAGVQAPLPEDPVQRRERAPVFPVLIEQLVEGLLQAEIPDIRAAEAAHDLLADIIGNPPRACEAAAVQPAIPVRSMAPVLERARRDAERLAGLLLGQPH